MYMHVCATGIGAVLSACILIAHIEYSTPVLVPIPDAGIGMGASLVQAAT